MKEFFVQEFHSNIERAISKYVNKKWRGNWATGDWSENSDWKQDLNIFNSRGPQNPNSDYSMSPVRQDSDADMNVNVQV